MDNPRKCGKFVAKVKDAYLAAWLSVMNSLNGTTPAGQARRFARAATATCFNPSSGGSKKKIQLKGRSVKLDWPTARAVGFLAGGSLRQAVGVRSGSLGWGWSGRSV